MKIHVSRPAAIAAGLFLAVPGISQNDERQSGADKPCQVVRSDIVLGAEARAKNNDKIGSIKDVGIDSSTGKIAFLVISTGGVLGIGDKERVVPCNVLSCDPKDKQLVLNLTKEDLEKSAAYDPKLLDEYHQRFIKTDRTRPADAAAHPDKPTPADRKEPITIKGKVTAVDRKPAADYDGCVVAEILDDNGTTHRVLLGPGNYLKSQGIDPVVGERIEVVACEANPPRSDAKILMASNIRCEKTKSSIQLRDASGRAQWDGPCCTLASKLDGAKVMCQTDKVGSVGNLFCDVTNANVAYLTLTTKDFGDGNATYLIPYRATWIDRDQALHLCATKEQMKTAPRLSSKEGIETSDPKFCTRVHEFYAVEPCPDTDKPVKIQK